MAENCVVNASLKEKITSLLYKNENPSHWVHHTWNSQYRHTLISLCCQIVEQCSQQDFSFHKPTYCTKVIEACKAIVTQEGRYYEYESGDYVFKFIDVLLEKASAFAPEGGILPRLQKFLDSEEPCCSYCVGLCFTNHLHHC